MNKMIAVKTELNEIYDRAQLNGFQKFSEWFVQQGYKTPSMVDTGVLALNDSGVN
jgi:hypothetical protein